MSENKYNVIVIGSGPGGYVAAIRAAQLKLRTALIEKELLGGICLNWGCIPTKALIESARLLDEMKHSSEFGLMCSDPKPDWSAIVKRSRSIAERMSKGVEFLLKKNKIDVYFGVASFKNEKTLNIQNNNGEQTLQADNIIIATGARARQLPGLEFDGTHIIGYREAMTLSKIPTSLLIVGAGAIGMEFAYIYSVMGAKITIVELLNQVVPNEDPEVATTLERSFSKRGITIYTSSTVQAVEKNSDNWKYIIQTPKGLKEIEADVCLIAVGVKANTEHINAEKIGLQIENGFFKVDQFMRTNVPGIYAIGDCIGAPLLAHSASHEGICAAETIANSPTSGISHNNIPSCIYCHPQVGSVGLTEKMAREKGFEIKTGKYFFRANGRAVAAGETDGFVKFVVNQHNDQIIGAHIIGPSASELIAEIVLGRQLQASIEDIANTIHSHPTFSEAIMEAAGDVLKKAIHI